MNIYKSLLKILMLGICCCFLSASPRKVHALFRSIDPQSVSQYLALYELYPQTPEGQQAFKKAWELLQGGRTQANYLPLNSLKASAIDSLVSLVNKQPDEKPPTLNAEELQIIEKLASNLPNRHLKGFQAQTEAEVLQLAPEEIDLAHALFISHLDEENPYSGKVYEAMMDLMALQILAKLPDNASAVQKIEAINRFIFFDMGFRFPPHSCYAKDIDLYTFLPSVLDSRRGVCLGVSLLYICLAQRLSLPIEMVTPPGHIYVRYRDADNLINIETTARGIHLDCEEYLGIDTRTLQERTIKEVIGLAHFNQAGAYMRLKDYAKTLACYQKAKLYLPKDLLLQELMGYTHLFLGQIEEGRQLLEGIKNLIPEHAVSPENLADDYLNGKTGVAGIEAIFMEVDDSRTSLLSKKEALENILHKYPQFRAGIFALATVYLQLHRSKEAMHWLNVYHSLHPQDATVEYYLAALCAERLNPNQAWTHLQIAEKLTQARDHKPKALKELRQQLMQQSPL